MKRIYSIPSNLSSNDVICFSWQTKKSKYLAVAIENIVNLYNRHGEHVDQINLFGYCTSLSWDMEGDWLAIITNRTSLIFFWNSISHKLEQIDTGMKETLSVMKWSKVQQSLLFLGTVKGNIMIYNNQTSRKLPVYGKHSKRIVSCDWSENKLIALVGEDHVLTINNEDGETISISSFKGEGSNVKFLHVYADEKNSNISNESNAVCLIINQKSLFIITLANSETPVSINFQDWYQTIVDYYCYSSGNLFVAFISGIIVTVSTCYKTFGSELTQIKAHKDFLLTFSVSEMTKCVASCSENNLKIFDLNDHNEIEHVFTVDDEPSISGIDWTHDGQLLAVASTTGNIHVYLSRLKIIGESYGTSLAFLSSLLEVTVFNVDEEVQDSVLIIRVEIEPSLIAIGPFHLAVAMNNKIWFYSLNGNELLNLLTNECEYVGIVKDVKLNEIHVAVLFTNGTIQFHSIEQMTSDDKQDGSLPKNWKNPAASNNPVFTYPEDGNNFTSIKPNQLATSINLTNDFLVFALENGFVCYFVIEDWNYIVVYRHTCSICLIQVNFDGTRFVFMDSRSECFVYSVFKEALVKIPIDHTPPKPLRILWESWLADRCVFTICDSKFVYIYSSPVETIDGPRVDFVRKMKIPGGQYPLLLYNGVIVCQTKSGKTSNFVLSTHDYSMKNKNQPESVQRETLQNIIKLRRYQDALKICSFLNDESFWNELAVAAIKDLEIFVAIRVYKQLQKFSIVYCLEKYDSDEQEHQVFCGLLAELIGEFDLAQKLFLQSSKPLYALEMRQNLHHWTEALALARHLSPQNIHFICRELAQHQEFSQQYQKALENFEVALNEVLEKRNIRLANETNANENSKVDEDKENEHIKLCQAGIARNLIRCGNVKRGISIISELNDPKLIQECATILEDSNYSQEAAVLYEKCSNFDRAASLYLKVNNLMKLDNLVREDRLKDAEILFQLAKIKESERQYRNALDIYTKAQQWIDVIRVSLDHLNNPGEAVKVVREHPSVEGAKLVAKFFQRLNDMTTAIEFLIMSKCYDEAYNLAQTTQQMDTYADIMQDYAGTTNETEGENEVLGQHFRTIAIYYEQSKNLFKAGKFYCLAHFYKKGVKLLLDSVSNRVDESPSKQLLSSLPETDQQEQEALTLAIDSAAQARQEQITRMVLDFLIGETDGIPRDFKHLFRLYMKLGQFREAAKTAIIIAREEQNMGNYRNAHQLLFGMHQELISNHHLPIPSELITNLLLIHSYILVKIWIRLGDHRLSSKLLIRINDNMKKFPSHSVQILTSLVLECMRVGCHQNALRFAHELMRSENRDKIDPKFKRRIENLVRKSSPSNNQKVQQLSNDELEQEMEYNLTSCPVCGEKVKETVFTCHGCRVQIPFCLASGMHLIGDDLTECPQCHFPANRSYFLKVLSNSSTGTCPMCSNEISVDQMKPVEKFQDLSYSMGPETSLNNKDQNVGDM